MRCADCKLVTTESVSESEDKPANFDANAELSRMMAAFHASFPDFRCIY